MSSTKTHQSYKTVVPASSGHSWEVRLVDKRTLSPRVEIAAKNSWDSSGISERFQTFLDMGRERSRGSYLTWEQLREIEKFDPEAIAKEIDVIEGGVEEDNEY